MTVLTAQEISTFSPKTLVRVYKLILNPNLNTNYHRYVSIKFFNKFPLNKYLNTISSLYYQSVMDLITALFMIQLFKLLNCFQVL